MAIKIYPEIREEAPSNLLKMIIYLLDNKSSSGSSHFYHRNLAFYAKIVIIAKENRDRPGFFFKEDILRTNMKVVHWGEKWAP